MTHHPLHRCLAGILNDDGCRQIPYLMISKARNASFLSDSRVHSKTCQTELTNQATSLIGIGLYFTDKFPTYLLYLHICSVRTEQ